MNAINHSTILTVPDGKGESKLSLDLTSVSLIESRIEEVRRANSMTIADLVVDFNIGLSRLGNLIGQVEYELEVAEDCFKAAKAIALIERVEEELKKRNIKSSADMRDALVYLDKDVQSSKERLNILTATLKHLQNKYKAIEMAYYSAKTVCDYQNTPLSANFGGSKKAY